MSCPTAEMLGTEQGSRQMVQHANGGGKVEIVPYSKWLMIFITFLLDCGLTRENFVIYTVGKCDYRTHAFVVGLKQRSFADE
jgi:hypothetical protein